MIRRHGKYSKRTSRTASWHWRFRSNVDGVVNGFRSLHGCSYDALSSAMTYVHFTRERGHFRMESTLRRTGNLTRF